MVGGKNPIVTPGLASYAFFLTPPISLLSLPFTGVFRKVCVYVWMVSWKSSGIPLLTHRLCTERVSTELSIFGVSATVMSAMGYRMLLY